jgi:hypothetical protein
MLRTNAVMIWRLSSPYAPLMRFVCFLLCVLCVAFCTCTRVLKTRCTRMCSKVPMASTPMHTYTHTYMQMYTHTHIHIERPGRSATGALWTSQRNQRACSKRQRCSKHTSKRSEAWLAACACVCLCKHGFLRVHACASVPTQDESIYDMQSAIFSKVYSMSICV